MPGYAVVGADSLAAKQQAKLAGLTHAVVQANWSALQPSGAGTALNSGELAYLNSQIADCMSAGLQPILEHALQYPPAWVLSAVEMFKDQGGLSWSSAESGKQVRNWMWTANGRTYVADLFTKVAAGLTGPNKAAIAMIRFG